MDKKVFYIFVIGLIVSLLCGIYAPIYKILVGLHFFQFQPPLNTVFIGNLGFAIAGISLFVTTFKEKN